MKLIKLFNEMLFGTPAESKTDNLIIFISIIIVLILFIITGQ